MSCGFMQLCEYGSLEDLNFIISEDFKNANHDTISKGMDLLCKRGEVEMIEYLINFPDFKEIVTREIPSHRTPYNIIDLCFYIACLLGNVRLMDLFLRKFTLNKILRYESIDLTPNTFSVICYCKRNNLYRPYSLQYYNASYFYDLLTEALCDLHITYQNEPMFDANCMDIIAEFL